MQGQFFSGDFISVIFLAAVILYTWVSVQRVLKDKSDDIPDQPDEDFPDRLVYPGREIHLSDEEIAHILSTYNAYYANLEMDLQKKFMERLKKFMRQKTFIIYAKEGYKEMPVLTSAAAIQVNFGLDDFLLPWFRFIQIHPEEYLEDGCSKWLNGNVEGNTITLAWKPFLKGNIYPGDGENVGVHEMAHALYYQNVVVEKKQTLFKKYFNELLEEGKHLFELHDKQPPVLSEYAYKNLQEFWAESVEMFFEQPAVMQVTLPKLYIIIKQLLHQDVLKKSNPLNENFLLS